MNPVKLIFKHGGEMLVSPIGLRFVEDPEHGPLVLIPEAQGPKAYQLDMTLEGAEQAYRDAASMQPLSNFAAVNLEEIEKKLEMHGRHLDNQGEAILSHGQRIRLLCGEVGDRWRALAIHLGLPEGWEHLHEGAAEVKGALVSQAEEIDELKRELSLLKEEASLFTLAERVGELEESRRIQREFLAKLSDEVRSLGAFKEEIHPTLSEKWEDTAFPLLDDRVCVQRQVDWTMPDGSKPQQAVLDLFKAEGKPKSAWKPLSEAPTRRPVFARASGDVECYSVTRAQWDGRHWAKRGGAGSIALAPASAYEFCPIPE